MYVHTCSHINLAILSPRDRSRYKVARSQSLISVLFSLSLLLSISLFLAMRTHMSLFLFFLLSFSHYTFCLCLSCSVCPRPDRFRFDDLASLQRLLVTQSADSLLLLEISAKWSNDRINSFLLSLTFQPGYNLA